MIRFASALALLAVAAVATTLPAQTGSPSAGPIDQAAMDRSVTPGENFFRLRQWHLAQAHTEIPADRSYYGSGAVVSELTDRRVVELIKRGRGTDAPAGSDVRRSVTYYAGFMDRPRSTPRVSSRCSRRSTRSPSIARSHRAGRFLGITLRADVDTFNTTNFYTANLLGLWVAQDLDDPPTIRRSWSRAGWGCPTGATTSTPPRRSPSPRGVPAHVTRCSGSPASRTRRRRPRRS